LAVILDVVYNHLGPEYNFMPRFSKRYMSDKHHTEWGEAINYDGEDSGPVRQFVTANVAHWIAEYHLDGLRIDAAQAFQDDSDEHILKAIGDAARRAAKGRTVFISAEDEPQETHLVRPARQRGLELDAIWCEDFHHTAVVALTGRREGYYADYHGSPQELVSCLKRGMLYAGQWNARQGKTRGASTDGVPREALVVFLENHDQVANWPQGRRLHQRSDPALYRTMTALLLLAPQTPMLFQGQEYLSSRPFHYFTDLNDELAPLVAQGRVEFVAQFPSTRCESVRKTMPNPEDEAALRAC
jgi:maltooligosyltrehalose trehalohydrolase